jgi:heme/copper-type cytochrome/quinol oxidase subunit 2
VPARHQFAVPDLGIDVKVQPRSSAVVTLPAAKAGRYAFCYDTCCGGKDNPTMQGKLIVS